MSVLHTKIHPSIHFLYSLNPTVGSWGGWGLCQWALGESTPWTGRQSITGPHRNKQPHTLTPRDNLETPINITCMLLDSGRKPEYPGRTHAYGGRRYMHYAERLRTFPGIEPGTPLAVRRQCRPLHHVQPTLKSIYQILQESLFNYKRLYMINFKYLPPGMSCLF